MRALALAALLFAPLTNASQALASEWRIDPEHSEIGFAVTHLMVSDVKGVFLTYQATLNVDERDPTTAKVDVVIDMDSVDTRSKKRDASLRGSDFFDVAKHPKMTFKSTKVVAGDAPGTFNVTGDLTIRGVTKPVVLAVQLSDEWQDPWSKRAHRGVKASTTISRRDFGMTWQSTMDRGGVVVGDEVRISIAADFIKKG